MFAGTPLVLANTFRMKASKVIVNSQMDALNNISQKEYNKIKINSAQILRRVNPIWSDCLRT